jgi:hypothetical protein
VFDAAVIRWEHLERVGEPPEPCLEAGSLLAGQPIVVPAGPTAKEIADVGPPASLFFGHGGQHGREARIGRLELAGRVEGVALQRGAPPACDGTTVARCVQRFKMAAGLRQVSHSLPGNPLVAR